MSLRNIALEMKFPNGNIVRKHYVAESLAHARQKARTEYPEATEYIYLYAWELSRDDSLYADNWMATEDLDE